MAIVQTMFIVISFAYSSECNTQHFVWFRLNQGEFDISTIISNISMLHVWLLSFREKAQHTTSSTIIQWTCTILCCLQLNKQCTWLVPANQDFTAILTHSNDAMTSMSEWPQHNLNINSNLKERSSWLKMGGPNTLISPHHNFILNEQQ